LTLPSTNNATESGCPADAVHGLWAASSCDEHDVPVKKKEFGPNQDEVDALLERLETVDQGQALFLAGLARDDEEIQAARDAMLDVARRGAREAELERAQREVTRWVNRWYSGGFQLSGYGRDITPAEAATGAAPVVLDAVSALVVRDLISPEAFETLIGRWRELDAM
jgi:hypothetical protein